MYHHNVPFYPTELAEMMQQGMFVPVMPGGRMAGRFVPFPAPYGFPMMHPMRMSNSSDATNHFPHWHPSAPGEGPPQMRKLFIGGLSHETSDEALRTYFSQWGHVVDAIVIREPNTKQSRGFGFVTFSTIASAETAMMERPHVIGGKTVDSKRAIPREQMTPVLPPPFFECEPAPGCKLMLTASGLHWDYHNVETLRIYFEKFGSLDQIEIFGLPRGLGFVVFEDKEGADKCLAHNSGRHMINEKKVDVKPFPRPTQSYWRRPRVPIYEQMATMSLSDAEQQHASYDEEESNYGGTTTEDDCKSSEHGSSSSALDSPSTSSKTSQ